MRRLVLVALLAVACGIAPGGPHSLALAFKAGDTYKYAVHAAINLKIGMQGNSIPVAADVTGKALMTVKSVDTSGIADVSITVSDLTTKTTEGGVTNTTTGTPATTVEVKIAPDGRVVGVGGQSIPAGPPGASTGQTGLPGGLLFALLPDGTVKRGDSWSKSYSTPNPKGSGSVDITTNSSYVSDDQLGGVSAARIESKTNVKVNASLDLASLLGPMLQSGSGMMPLPGMLPGGSASELTPPSPPSGVTIKPGLPVMPMVQNLTIQGTNNTDVTTWVDPATHRIVKDHSTGTTTATITFAGGTVAPASGMPFLSGPITVTGTDLFDLS